MCCKGRGIGAEKCSGWKADKRNTCAVQGESGQRLFQRSSAGCSPGGDAVN